MDNSNNVVLIIAEAVSPQMSTDVDVQLKESVEGGMH